MHVLLTQRGSRAFSLTVACRHRLREFGRELLREVHLQGTGKMGFQGSCITYFTANMQTCAICSHLLYSLYKPREGHYVNTQPAGLENIRPLSCALETWTGGTSPLKGPNITPFYQPLTRGASTLLPGKLFRYRTHASSWGTPRDKCPRGGPQGLSASTQKLLGSRRGGSRDRCTPKTCPGPGHREHHSCWRWKRLSLLLWLRSMDGSRSVDFHHDHPASDT